MASFTRWSTVFQDLDILYIGEPPGPLLAHVQVFCKIGEGLPGREEERVAVKTQEFGDQWYLVQPRDVSVLNKPARLGTVTCLYLGLENEHVAIEIPGEGEAAGPRSAVPITEVMGSRNHMRLMDIYTAHLVSEAPG